MKTICSWDNVACIVDNFPQSLDSVILPFVVIIGAIIGACVVATLASKKE